MAKTAPIIGRRFMDCDIRLESLGPDFSSAGGE
jgi:hypothetical protein